MDSRLYCPEFGGDPAVRDNRHRKFRRPCRKRGFVGAALFLAEKQRADGVLRPLPRKNPVVEVSLLHPACRIHVAEPLVRICGKFPAGGDDLLYFKHAACRIFGRSHHERAAVQGARRKKRQNRDYHNQRYLRSRAYIEFIQRQRDGPCREYLPGVQRRRLRLPVCDNFPSQRKSDSLYRRALGA